MSRRAGLRRAAREGQRAVAQLLSKQLDNHDFAELNPFDLLRLAEPSRPETFRTTVVEPLSSSP